MASLFLSKTTTKRIAAHAVDIIRLWANLPVSSRSTLSEQPALFMYDTNMQDMLIYVGKIKAKKLLNLYRQQYPQNLRPSMYERTHQPIIKQI